MEKYNGYTMDEILHFYEIGENAKNNGVENIDSFIIELIYQDKLNHYDICNHAEDFIKMGFDGIKPTIKKYYRIGEPIRTEGRYYRDSWNFAEDKPENGVSVITMNWLNSLKSVFFGAHDSEKLKSRGVWEIIGIEISTGGDNEITIYPMGWAKKTKISSISGIKKALKNNM